MDGYRVALECVGITLCCAQLWPVCALPKRRLTSAAAAALATCRKLTESAARRNKLVLPPLGGLAHIACLVKRSGSGERQRHANQPQAPQSVCRSLPGA